MAISDKFNDTSKAALNGVLKQPGNANPLPGRGQEAAQSVPAQTVTIPNANWNLLLPYSFSVGVARKNFASASGIWMDYSKTPEGFNFNQVSLRIPPSAISMSTPFAISVVPTNQGILEEHNGVVFRHITLSGTTGMQPFRKSSEAAAPLFGKLAQVFPATSAAVTNVINSANTVANFNAPSGRKSAEVDKFETGYFQFHNLHNFFIAYAMAKKKVSQRDLRLVFNNLKDGYAYLVTPISFDMRKDASSPLIYRYTISLRAWAIVNPAPQEIFEHEIPTPDNIAIVKKVTNKLREARLLMQSSRNALQAVNSDFASIMNVLTQTMMVGKDLAGVAQEVLDFPQILSNNADILLAGAANSTLAALEFKGNSVDSVDESESQNPSGGTQSSTAATAAASGASISQSSLTQGGETKVASTSSAQTQAQGVLTDSIDNDPTFQSTPLESLSIDERVQAEIDDATTTALNTTSGQVRDLASNVQLTSDNFAQSLGVMHPVYASTYGLPAPALGPGATEDDIILQVALQDSKQNTLAMLATGQIFREREPDPFLAANQSLDANDQMATPLSSIPVPYQRDATLEEMAHRYLRDANRAREIAVLNGLRAPYIDEEGFDITIAGANERSFIVTEIDRLEIGQKLTLKGTGVTSSQRRIINITEIAPGQYRVAVDGQSNLSIYNPGTMPFIHTRLPGTIGSGDTILIPDPTSPSDTLANRPTPLLARLTQAEKLFKVDLALDSKFARDLVVDANGDIARKFGYDNAAQAIRLIIETGEGELPQHPTYGLGIPVGIRSTDVSITDLQAQIQQKISADPRFLGADTNITIDGTAVRVSVNAFGAQGTGQIPLEFEIGQS